MPASERKRRRAEKAKEVRATARRERIEAQASAAAQPPDIHELNAMLKSDGQNAIGWEEYDAFSCWCKSHDLDMHEESYADWKGDADGGARFDFEPITACDLAATRGLAV